MFPMRSRRRLRKLLENLKITTKTSSKHGMDNKRYHREAKKFLRRLEDDKRNLLLNKQ